ncbi:hypothetical protein L1987_60013 [Smallanthus sonchifolius]|uniref:Uncharacterized protein n=1 Tax=Smallanthus sonchifolius TaxID=185202 RepID=A0ACB9D797_9ASTR|nr:hypothetical protein L1987_60013 [Smallanthus sonchifolius]
MKKIEDNLGKLYLEFPEDEDILSLKAEYETMLEDKPMWHMITKEEIIITKDQISSVLKGFNLEKVESNEQREEEVQETETVAREIGEALESEENVEFGNTDMMESNICGGDKDTGNVIELPTKMCDEVTKDEGEELALDRLGGQENICADKQTDNEWTEG